MAGVHPVPEWLFTGLVLFNTFIYKLGVQKRSLFINAQIMPLRMKNAGREH